MGTVPTFWVNDEWDERESSAKNYPPDASKADASDSYG